MATQLSGLDGHHFSLRSILKNPSTLCDAELAGLQSISLTEEMNLQPGACGAEVFLKFVDAARASPL